MPRDVSGVDTLRRLGWGSSDRPPMSEPDELAVFKRKMSNARREIRNAVHRFAEIDPLAGHRAEALRLARQLRQTADDAVKRLSE